MGAEIYVLPECLTEWLVAGQSGLVEGLQVQRDESLTLLVGHLQVAVHVDDASEAEPAREAVRPAEGFSHEPGQVIDVGRHAQALDRDHRVRSSVVRFLARQRPSLEAARFGASGRTLDDLLEAARAGRAVGLVPASVARSQKWPSLAFVAVTDIPPSDVAVAWRTDRRSPLVEKFIALATER